MKTKNCLTSSIVREETVCDLAIQESKNRCKVFEKKYRISSDKFYNLFTKGKMGDEEELFEWKALIEGIKEWSRTREGLRELITK